MHVNFSLVCVVHGEEECWAVHKLYAALVGWNHSHNRAAHEPTVPSTSIWLATNIPVATFRDQLRLALVTQ
jgi:hypothetical protein